MTRTPTAAAPATTAVFIPLVLGCAVGFEPGCEPEKITDVSKRKYVLKVEMGQKYKVLVTASNKYGESSKKGMVERVDVPEGGLSASLTE